MLFLVFESTSALLHVGPRRLFTDPSWHPAAAADAGSFNLSPILLGTLLTSAGAILPATVIGLMSATFVHFYARPGFARCYRRMVEWLAGVPSVTYGLWGLT